MRWGKVCNHSTHLAERERLFAQMATKRFRSDSTVSKNLRSAHSTGSNNISLNTS